MGGKADKDRWTLSSLRATMHMYRLEYRNLIPLKKLSVTMGCLIVIILFYKLSVYTFITNIKYHTDIEKCPACFGSRICGRIHETSVHGKEKFHHINKLVNVKNVYFGEINGVEMVYKKMAHDTELDRIDDYIRNGGLRLCSEHKSDGYTNHALCVSKGSIHKSRASVSESAKEISQNLAGPLTADLLRQFTDTLQCPSDRLIHRLMDRFQERSVFHHQDLLNEEDKFMLLYTLAVNPEPLILQSFPSGEGWPFAAYVGACGRMVAVENSGRPLREYFYSDWKTRVTLSLRLLEIASQLTDNASGYKLYFSDLSLDNYVVDDNLRVSIADAENILIVDEQQVVQDKPDGYKEAHRAVFDECPEKTNCLSVDLVTLCRRTQSDFNFYAVCRSILSSYSQDEIEGGGGLLHSPPNTAGAWEISRLANTCAKPKPHEDRFVTSDLLITKLKTELKRLDPSTI